MGAGLSSAQIIDGTLDEVLRQLIFAHYDNGDAINFFKRMDTDGHGIINMENLEAVSNGFERVF